jgi:hypothetical protein
MDKNKNIIFKINNIELFFVANNPKMMVKKKKKKTQDDGVGQ